MTMGSCGSFPLTSIEVWVVSADVGAVSVDVWLVFIDIWVAFVLSTRVTTDFLSFKV